MKLREGGYYENDEIEPQVVGPLEQRVGGAHGGSRGIKIFSAEAHSASGDTFGTYYWHADGSPCDEHGNSVFGVCLVREVPDPATLARRSENDRFLEGVTSQSREALAKLLETPGGTKAQTDEANEIARALGFVDAADAVEGEQWPKPGLDDHTDAVGYAILGVDLAKQEPDIKREIGEEAIKIVSGARRAAYGKPENNFERIAAFWRVYFKNTGRDVDITAADVSPMMRLMKEARLCESPDHRDSFVDIIGYALTGAEINLKKS